MNQKLHWLPNQHVTISKKKAVWQVKEPENDDDPIEHQSYIRKHLGDGGLLIGASVRGKNNAHIGKWKEDFYSYNKIGLTTVFTVADGVGSCPLSRVGARIACETAINCLSQYIKINYSKILKTTASDSDFILKKHLERCVMESILALEKEANERHVAADALSTTLIVLIIVKNRSNHVIASLQVGDGLVCLKNNLDQIVIIGEPDYGDFGGQSKFLTSSGIPDELDQRTIICSISGMKSLAMMTDGIADDFFPFKDGLEYFFKDIEKQVLQETDPLNRLKSWIQYDKIGSYDDRTLLLVSYK